MKKKEDTFQNKIEEYHSWNFPLNVAASGFENFGLSLVGYTTVLPAFLTLFTKSNFIVGLLPAVFVFFWTFPQIASSLYTGHLHQKKNIIVFMKVGYALPWLILSILTLLVLKEQSSSSLVLFFVFYSLFALIGGFATPPWVSFISKLIFPTIRGRFYGLRVFVGTSFGILASFIVKDVLEKYRYPMNFSIIFLLAFSMFLLGIIFLAISKEPIAPYQERRKSFSEYFHELRDTIRDDKTFVWFITSTMIRSFSVMIMAAAFYTIYAIRQLHVSLDQAGTFMGIMLSAQLAGALLLGYINDLKGPRRIQIANRVFEFLSVGAVLLRGDITGIYIGFGFLGLATSSMLTSYHNMIIELAPKGKVDTYMGLINGIRAPSLAIGPLVGGFLADSFSYRTLFVVALFASLFSGLVLSLKVKERHQQALRV
ncbi:MAG TPA: MFS transporter [Candidatus Omnitrophica bacterium]|nr:MFS transporter [Candidatus Omnitrophota bacterium]